MTTTEELKLEVKELENQIKLKVDRFVEVNGECSVNISCFARIIHGIGGDVFLGHDIEVTVTI